MKKIIQTVLLYSLLLGAYLKASPTPNLILPPKKNETFTKFGLDIEMGEEWLFISQPLSEVPSGDFHGSIHVHRNADWLAGDTEVDQLILGTTILEDPENDFMELFGRRLRLDEDSGLLVVQSRVEVDFESEFQLNVFRLDQDLENDSSEWFLVQDFRHVSDTEFDFDIHQGMLWVTDPAEDQVLIFKYDGAEQDFLTFGTVNISSPGLGSFIINPESKITGVEIQEDLVVEQVRRQRLSVALSGSWSAQPEENALVLLSFDQAAGSDLPNGSLSSSQTIPLSAPDGELSAVTSLSMTQNWLAAGFAESSRFANSGGAIYLWRRTPSVPAQVSLDPWGWLLPKLPDSEGTGIEPGDGLGRKLAWDGAEQSLLVAGTGHTQLFRNRLQDTEEWGWAEKIELPLKIDDLVFGQGIGISNQGIVISEAPDEAIGTIELETVYLYERESTPVTLVDDLRDVLDPDLLAQSSSFIGIATGNSLNASREPSEPRHNVPEPLKTTWMLWTAPAEAVVSFDTEGSSYDTVLAVYPLDTGVALEDLTFSALDQAQVVTNDDATELFEDNEGNELAISRKTSRVDFNTRAGAHYLVVVGGQGAAGGWTELRWIMDQDENLRFPTLATQPRGRTYEEGNVIPLEVTLLGSIDSSNYDFVWWYNNSRIVDYLPDHPVRSIAEGEDTLTLTLNGLTKDVVGDYKIQVIFRQDPRYYVFSDNARIEQGEERRPVQQGLGARAAGTGLSYSGTTSTKLDSVLAQLVGGGLNGFQVRELSRFASSFAPQVAVGIPGTQFFENHAEPILTSDEQILPSCTPVFGLSRYWSIEAEDSGLLSLNAVGSDVEVGVTVYRNRAPFLDLFTLENLACIDSGDSYATFCQEGDQFILVFDADYSEDRDGEIQFNWELDAIIEPGFEGGYGDVIEEITVVEGQPLEILPRDQADPKRTYLWRWPDGVTTSQEAVIQIDAAKPEHDGIFEVIIFNVAGVGASRKIQVNVEPAQVNQAPEIIRIEPPELVVPERGTLSFIIELNDDGLPSNSLDCRIISGPIGIAIEAIDSKTYQITWTLGEAIVSGDYTVEIQVSDGELSAVLQISIRVNEVNQAPTLGPLGPFTINELELFTYSVSGTDGDIPQQTLSYSLSGNVPEGLSLNSSSGEMTWTPSEVQGPGEYDFEVSVSDGELSASQQMSIQVNEVNVPPAFVAKGPFTVNVPEELTFTLMGTDSDFPANTLSYSLAEEVLGVSVDEVTGVVRWTPSEVQGDASYDLKFGIFDGSATTVQTVQVSVNEVNRGPSLAELAPLVANELEAMTFTAVGSDEDLPEDDLTYSLIDTPEGATIDSATGVFTWTPSEEQGPGIYEFEVEVSDGELNARRTVLITVNEVNQAPTLGPLGPFTINELEPFTYSVLGTDGDIPAQNLSYSLKEGSPDGLVINNSTGELSWTPNEEQGPRVYEFELEVSDGELISSQTVEFTVNEVNLEPVLQGYPSIILAALGQGFEQAVVLSDEDIPQQQLSLKLIRFPEGLSFDMNTMNLVWNSNDSISRGVYPLEIEISDGIASGINRSWIVFDHINESNEPALNIYSIPGMERESLILCIPTGLPNWSYTIERSGSENPGSWEIAASDLKLGECVEIPLDPTGVVHYFRLQGSIIE